MRGAMNLVANVKEARVITTYTDIPYEVPPADDNDGDGDDDGYYNIGWMDEKDIWGDVQLLQVNYK